MAVFVTRNMLSKMNRVSYPTFTKLETVSLEGDHWQKLCAVVSNDSSALSKTMICRVCGCDGYTPITEKTNGVYIVDALRSISNIMVELHDSLPKFICTSCLEKLKVAIEFKNMCQASDRKFKKILNPMGDPSLHTYPYSRHDFQLILKDIKAKRMEIEERKEKQRQLKEQMRMKSSVKGKHFVCSSCDMNFAKREQLVEHRREGKCMKRACDICGELVTGIRQHMRLIHKQRHCCTVCGKEFPVQARLKNHMLVHTNTFNFFCDLCPYKCKHKYYLVMHMRTHTGEKPYKCQQCPATFVNPSNLNKHKLTHQEKQFKCTLCEKTFRTNAALREHHDAAHMNIKHTCHYCGRDFCYRSDLRKHEIRSHNRTKRDYIGGEPTYKQVERMQKQQEVIPVEDTTKWRQEVIVQPQQIIQTYIDIEGSKNYATDATHQAIYFSDGNGILQQPLHMFQQQTVEITLPELMKKDDVKITYEPQQSIGYF